jgi:16S rRNA processing protein RimM
VASSRRSSGQPRLRELAGRSDVRWIALGYVVGAHGLRGTLRVKQHNLHSDLLFQLHELATRLNGTVRVHGLSEVRETPKGVLLQLDDVQSIEAAELLRSAELCVPREFLPPLEPGEFYHVDLERLPVFNVAGEQVGIAERVQEYPAADVLRVRNEAGVWEVPMREPYFVDVDLEAGRITVDALDDLELERDRAPSEPTE